MNRRFHAMLLMCIVIALSACSTTTPTPSPSLAYVDETPIRTPLSTIEVTPSPSSLIPSASPSPVYDEVEAIDFFALLEEVNQQNKKMISESSNSAQAKQLYKSIDYENLLSKEKWREISAEEDGQYIPPEPYERNQYLSAAIKDDIYLLHKVLKSHYGAYEYFGGDAKFWEEMQPVMTILNQTTYISREMYERDFLPKLFTAISYIRDKHFYLSPCPEFYDSSFDDDKHVYCYCEHQSFAKDGHGYYKYINGEKWYFSHFTDENAKLAPTLLESGKIVYAPVWFSSLRELKESCKIFLFKDGRIRSETIHWLKAEALIEEGYQQHMPSGYEYTLSEDQVGYVAIRTFDRFAYKEDTAAFVQTGKALKSSNVIVFDVRSNGGGSDTFPRDWIKNFSGTYPVYPRVTIGKDYQNEKLHIDKFDGKYITNDIPILVLTDSQCGSAGESALNYMRTMENTIRIGTNSAGAQICGSSALFRLPYTQINFSAGFALHYMWNGENVDGRGYEPDIWCDAKIAHTAVMNMIEYYNIAQN